MIVCAESSAVLRWIFGTPQAAEVAKILSKAEEVFSSRLTLVEVERVLVRQIVVGALREADAAEARRLWAAAVAQWRVVEITQAICERAGLRFAREPLRTLDAIHLATALFVNQLAADVWLLSTDARLCENAEMLGLRCLSVG